MERATQQAFAEARALRPAIEEPTEGRSRLPMINKEMATKAMMVDHDWGKVQRQISLPWGQAFRISIKNVLMRLGRAAITAAGVILGIAFLMSVWTSKVATEGLERYKAESTRSVAAGGDTDALQMQEAAQEQQSKAARMTWLVVMSLLVCGVGITNSMLMSVTERFREIGTMKCLGAVDEFIVRLFLIESAVLGTLGSIVGAIIGLLVMLLVYVIKEGSSVPALMNWSEMLRYLLIGIGLGTLLSLFAAVPPAMRAAKLPPAAALATEV